jgi:hypothetical protein
VRKKIILGLAYAFCLSVGTAFGQTVTQIKEKYGQPIEAYSVSEGIWMTPEFTDDGQLCRMRLYPKRISSTTSYLYDNLDHWELTKVLEQLAPAEKRGKKTEFWGITLLLGQSSQTTFSYENVSVSFLASLHFRRADTKQTQSPAVEEEQTNDAEESDEVMTVPHAAEIAIITWTGKTCAKK